MKKQVSDYPDTGDELIDNILNAQLGAVERSISRIEKRTGKHVDYDVNRGGFVMARIEGGPLLGFFPSVQKFQDELESYEYVLNLFTDPADKR